MSPREWRKRRLWLHPRRRAGDLLMALQDIAASLSGGLPHQTCGTCHALAGMSDEDAATLRGLLSDRGVRFKDLAAAMADDPDLPTVPWESLSRHARRGCSARESLR